MWASSNCSLVRPSITTAPAATASSTSNGVIGSGVPKPATSGPRLSATICSTFGGRSGREEVALSTNSASLGDRQRRVVGALEADRRGALQVDPGAAAERAAEVAGPDLDLVVQRQQPVVQRVEHLRGAFARLDRQVGAGDVADEERVAGEERPGGAAAARVGEQEAGVLGPVAGGVDRLDREVADRQRPAVGEGLVLVLRLGELVDVDGGAGLPHQPAVAGDVVGVVVGLEDVADPHAVQAGEAAVGLDVPLRVDDDGDAAFAVGDQVGRAAEVLVDDLAKEHGQLPPMGLRLARSGAPGDPIGKSDHRLSQRFNSSPRGLREDLPESARRASNRRPA